MLATSPKELQRTRCASVRSNWASEEELDPGAADGVLGRSQALLAGRGLGA